MSAIPSGPNAGGEAGRVRCAYCGANNFPSSAACWQCGRPMQPLRGGTAPAAVPPPLASAQSQPAWPGAAGGIPAARPFGGVNPGLAPKAAAALGLFFPWAGLPIGMAFLMMDDPRKAQLGWIAIGWSIGGTILSILTLILPLLGLLPMLKSLAPHAGGAGVPGLPPLGGGEDVLAFTLLFRAPP